MEKNKFKLFHEDFSNKFFLIDTETMRQYEISEPVYDYIMLQDKEDEERIKNLIDQLNALERELSCLKDMKESEISKLQKQIEILKDGTQNSQYTIECGTAISVVQDLIDMDICGKNILGHDSSMPYYSKSELKQIAEHLLVYVNNTDDERE